jgi:hypothetical protein
VLRFWRQLLHVCVCGEEVQWCGRAVIGFVHAKIELCLWHPIAITNEKREVQTNSVYE